MARIFISYRRDDSAYVAGMLSEKLQEYFGKESVFIDIDTIPFGIDFRNHINSAVEQCDVLLVLIGDSWLNASSADGRRKIDNQSDFVRVEIECALKRGIPVIPVLLDDANMPIEDELPPSLRHLVYRNAAEIRSGRNLHHHVETLISGIRPHFRVKTHQKSKEHSATPHHKEKSNTSSAQQSHLNKKRRSLSNRFGRWFGGLVFIQKIALLMLLGLIIWIVIMTWMEAW